MNGWTPTAAAARAAREALDVRASLPRSQRAGTLAGLARARQLAARRHVSADTVRRMVAFFARNARFADAAPPSKSWQAWNLWGGDAAREALEQRMACCNPRHDDHHAAAAHAALARLRMNPPTRESAEVALRRAYDEAVGQARVARFRLDKAATAAAVEDAARYAAALKHYGLEVPVPYQLVEDFAPAPSARQPDLFGLSAGPASMPRPRAPRAEQLSMFSNPRPRADDPAMVSRLLADIHAMTDEYNAAGEAALAAYHAGAYTMSGADRDARAAMERRLRIARSTLAALAGDPKGTESSRATVDAAIAFAAAAPREAAELGRRAAAAAEHLEAELAQAQAMKDRYERIAPNAAMARQAYAMHDAALATFDRALADLARERARLMQRRNPQPTAAAYALARDFGLSASKLDKAKPSATQRTPRSAAAFFREVMGALSGGVVGPDDVLILTYPLGVSDVITTPSTYGDPEMLAALAQLRAGASHVDLSTGKRAQLARVGPEAVLGAWKRNNPPPPIGGYPPGVTPDLPTAAELKAIRKQTKDPMLAFALWRATLADYLRGIGLDVYHDPRGRGRTEWTDTEGHEHVIETSADGDALLYVVDESLPSSEYKTVYTAPQLIAIARAASKGSTRKNPSASPAHTLARYVHGDLAHINGSKISQIHPEHEKPMRAAIARGWLRKVAGGYMVTRAGRRAVS